MSCCDSTPKKIGWSCCCFFVILIPILIICSYSTLQATEIGLDYDTVSEDVDETTLYQAGRHFLGLSHSFLSYQTQVQPLYFDGKSNPALACRSKDGLLIEIFLGFQYRLKTSLQDILQLFYAWPNLDYQDGYKIIAINVIRDAISNFTAFELVYNRTVVETEVRATITNALDDYHAIVDNVQLLDINFPSSFDTAISNTQNEDLNVQTAIFNLTKIQNEVTGDIKQANASRSVIVNQAEIAANSLKQLALGEAAAQIERIQQQIASLSQLKSTLGFSDEGLIAFQWIDSLDKLDNQRNIQVNLKTPMYIDCISKNTC